MGRYEATFPESCCKSSRIASYTSNGACRRPEMFRVIVDIIFRHIMRTPPSDSHNRRTVPLPERLSGALGIPVAAYGCTEEQARGSLHMHTVFWGRLSPAFLQEAVGIHLLADAISKAIDIIVCGELDPVTHFRHLLRDLRGKTSPHACLYQPQHPLEEPTL